MSVPKQREFEVDSRLLDFLVLTETRPGMYYGSCRVSDVQKVLQGWMLHRKQVADEDAFADAFAGFHAFVSEEFGDNRSVGWAGLIAEKTETDKEGFALFMRLVRSFAARHFDRVT